MLELFCDGASRSNPGPAGAGALLYDKAGNEIAALRKRLGKATNNEAEYQGLLLGLEEALARGERRIAIKMDSEVVVRHLKREYRVKAANLRPLYERAKELLSRFSEWNVIHIPREENARADQLANEAIDGLGES